jgi:transcription-repair coupling factor (superfamily II helicase)
MRKVAVRQHTVFNQALRELFGLIAAGEKNIRISGLQGSAWSFLLAVLSVKIRKTLVLVTSTDQEAARYRSDLAFFLGEQDVTLYPPWDTLSVDLFSVRREVEIARIEVLCRLLSKRPLVVIAPYLSLIQKTLPKRVLEDYLQNISIGDNLDRDVLTAKMIAGGYRQTTLVEERGEFSLRGHVVDIFPPTEAKPLRIELFGDEIESIRFFEPGTQRSIKEIADFVLSPAREEIAAETNRPQVLANVKTRLQELDLSKGIRNRLLETIESQWTASINPLFLPLFYDNPTNNAVRNDGLPVDPVNIGPSGTLLDFLSSDSIVVYDDLQALEGSSDKVEMDIDRLLAKAAVEEKFFIPRDMSFATGEYIRHGAAKFQQIDKKGLLAEHGVTDLRSVVTFQSEPVEGIRKSVREPGNDSGLLDSLIDHIHRWTSDGYLIVLVCTGHEDIQRIQNLLDQYDLIPGRMEHLRLTDIDHYDIRSNLVLTEGNISNSFDIPALKLVVINSDEIFGRKVIRRRLRTAREGFFLKSFSELTEGDYVVHTDHGIGVYRGLQKLTVGGIDNDFLVVEYLDNDRLYLPVDRLDHIQRYLGPEGHIPKIDRLGGTSWDAVKERVKKSVRDVAEELVSVYAVREIMTREAFTPPDRLYQEFASCFPFEETPDQIKAIDDIHQDMSDQKPMDRLICGDAGFGKTEVALRASFRAVMDGKQVAVLVPTTILAEQHYHTYCERLKDYPIHIAVLNRLKTKAEQQAVLKDLQSGTVDILIGTHRILQKDVQFKNLGLVVVDEEQRFGVTHKEKLKKLRTLVDVLTLSATPIPRTLHLSLVGIRDLSIINTPPEDRMPIKTYVLEFNEDIIREAIEKELARGGQVFFVHDRIQSIYSMARLVSKLNPEASIGIIHGRMKSKDIEDTMVRFVKKEYNILVCTTIVASGVDIPTANTIIINRADRFGLSQLYQIRGRVGRSKEEAYAYLFVPKGAMLSRDAQKRLQVIMDLSDPGSGFRIASNDLEIRGAGNLLGISQSGHVSAVGYELYTELMEKTIRELKGETIPEEETKPEIQLGIPAFIPEEYMVDKHTRLLTYKKLSIASTDGELDQIREELTDSYGFVPVELENLFSVIRIKNCLAKIKGKRMLYDGTVLSIAFDRNSPLDPARLVKLAKREFKGMRFTPDLKLNIPLTCSSPQDISDKIMAVLHALKDDYHE